MTDSRVGRRRAWRAEGLRRRGIAFIISILLPLVAFPVTRATVASPQDNNRPRKNGPKVEFVPGELLVRFRAGAETVQTAQADSKTLAVRGLDGHDIRVEVEEFEGSKIIPDLRMARVAPEDTLTVAEALKERPDVLYAEPNFIWRKTAMPDDPRYPEMWALKNTGQVGFNEATGQQAPGTVGADIDAESAWETTTGSSDVVVAVIDEGIDVNHSDLRDNIWTNPGEIAGNNIDDDANGFVDDVNGWDFVHNDKTVYDGAPGDVIDYHGTHVAGTIGARGNNALGVTGVNWQVSLMSLKVLGPDGGTVADIIKAYNYVLQMRQRGVNVRVTNNSYGSGGFSQATFDAIGQLNDAGILFVAAAGNDGQDNFNFPQYPSGYDLPNVISVAATNSFDQLAGFSNSGARKVNIGAPGRGIWSTAPNNTYDYLSGTSMASPHVAGTAALVLSVNPNISLQNLRGALVFGGEAIPALEGKTTTGRRLNAANAVRSALEGDVTAPSAADLRVASQKGREVTLQWAAPGDDADAGTASDYDIFFVYPSGERLLLPTTLRPAPSGATQSATVKLPYQNFSGSIELRAYDNAGNFSTASIPVAVTQNESSDPYISEAGPAEVLSTGGTPLALHGDDAFRENQTLPFPFPFFGETKSAVTISTNGALYFSRIPRDGSGNGLDAGGSVAALNGQSIIAGAWDDLRTDKGGDVFVLQPDATRVIYRWEAVTFNTPLNGGTSRGEQPVNFEIELRKDGTIILRYGAGQSAPTNTGLFPVVGIGGGEPDAYVVASHTSSYSLKNLTNAGAITFTPRKPDGPAAAAPSNLVATAVSATQVSLTWDAAPDAAGYEVERSQSVNGPYSTISSNSTTNSFTDTSAAGGTAYIYRVRAVFASRALSGYSNPDLATTIIFTDDPLISGVTPIKGLHLTELRQAVAAVRATAALSPRIWTDSSPAGFSIRATHIEELRSGLDEALAALGFSVESYTDSTLTPKTTLIKRVHFMELRQRVK